MYSHRMVKRMIETDKECIKLRDKQEETAVHHAAARGHLKVIEVMLECAPDSFKAVINASWEYCSNYGPFIVW